MNNMNYDEIFDIFKSSYVGKEIKKDVILDKLLHADDKEIIERFVNNLYIKYSVKAENINKKAEENFEEIQIIEVSINDYRAIYDIYGILLSIIPYPILAIFRYNDRISFAVSNRILAEDKNNKGKIYTSYLIKEEDISRYLKINIDRCQNMIDIYNEWISNVEDAVAYYERLDRVMEIIEIGLHIKNNEVLEKLESYITRDCGTYNMKPKEGWNSKLEKYSDSSPYVKKVETHILWEYLSENTFLKNKIEDFLNWNDFKEACSYSNSMNDMYYSQYNSRMSDNDEIDDLYENRRNKRYANRSTNIKVEIIKNESKRTNNIDDIINDLVEEVKETGSITYSNLAETLSEKFGKTDKKTINKVVDVFEKNNIEVLDDEEDNEENENYEFKEYQKQLLQTIEAEPTALEQADYEIKDDKNFMLQAIKIDNLCLRYASDRLKNDKEFMLQAIEEEGLNIKHASDELRDDENFILEATRIDDFSLIYASDRLKNDSDFMLSINEINGRNLAYASDELKNDKEFILSAAETNMWALAFATDELRNDKEFVSQIVEKNSWALKHASDELKNDKDVVLKAIKRDGWFLIYARSELRNNREFLLEAINKNKECMAFANDNLKNEILSNLDENDSLNEEQKDNAEYMLKLIKKDYFNIRYASDRLKSDSDFISKSMKTGDMGFKCLAYATDELKSNKDFVLKIFREIGNYTFALASETLKCDKEFILKLLEFNYLDFADVGYELRSNKDFMINAISKNAETIEFASYELRNDKEFVLQAIKNNPLCFVYASDELKNNKDFMLQAFKKDNRSLAYASDKLKNNKEFMGEINKIIENSMTLEVSCVCKWDFLYRNERYGLVSYLEKNGISVLEKDEFSMKLYDRETAQVIECNHTPLSVINRIFNEPETNYIDYYILDWKLHLSGATKENLEKFDSYMRRIKLAYNISQIKNNEKKTIIEYTSEDIEVEEKNEPIRLYMDKHIKNEEDNIIVKVNDIKPHIILYLSNMISMLANNNNIKYRDYIAIVDDRNSFRNTWLFLMKNDIKYIYKYKIKIFGITENILTQIEKFLQGFDVKYYIQKIFDNVILVMYPKNEEVISFVNDVLILNKIDYYDYNVAFNDSEETSLWMFDTSKEEKKEISNILNEPDQAKVNRLKEFGAPDILVQHELEPKECNFGIIIDVSLQNQIENILQSLKLEFTIMDKYGEIIEKRDCSYYKDDKK